MLLFEKFMIGLINSVNYVSNEFNYKDLGQIKGLFPLMFIVFH